MIDVIILRGPPGAGKTTVGRWLAGRFPRGVTVEVDLVRWMINSATWTESLEHRNALDASQELTRSYLRSGYTPAVFIGNFSADAVVRITSALHGYSHRAFALAAREEVLRRRIELRKRGFRDVATSLAMSRAIAVSRVRGETIIDTSDLEPAEVGRVLLAAINGQCSKADAWIGGQ